MTFGGGRKRSSGWAGGAAPHPRCAQHPPRAQELALGCKSSFSNPRQQPRFLHLLKENRHFGEIAVPSDAERPPHPRPTRCVGTVRSGTRRPILSPSPRWAAPARTHRTWPGTAPPSLVPGTDVWPPNRPRPPRAGTGCCTPRHLAVGPTGVCVSTQGCLRPLRSLIAAATFAGCRLVAGASWICLISVDGY